ncbi:hypothetical protein BaRGS_00029823 [Batillaria attramentaria]|uniref:Uncharacterized protein n=1 Tax=Batillaria attramentaria TaxID=370345 RepID=A0ABD0JV41_9CAEN
MDGWLIVSLTASLEAGNPKMGKSAMSTFVSAATVDSVTLAGLIDAQGKSHTLMCVCQRSQREKETSDR